MVPLRSVWHTTEKLTVLGKSRPSTGARREPYRQLAYAAFVFEVSAEMQDTTSPCVRKLC